jgi:hypothetical protein
MLRTEIVEYFANDSDAFIFSNSGAHEAVKLLVSRVHHHTSRIEQCNLVLCFDFPNLMHQLLAVDDFDPLRLQGKQNRHFDDIDAERFLIELAHLKFGLDLFRQTFCQARARMGRATQGGDTRAGALGEPWAIDLVVARRRAEIPNDRFVVLGQEREAHQFIHGPGADVGGGDVADVVHVET